jgi:ribosomal protein L37E
MARYGPDGCATPTNLLEAAAWHVAIVATCRRCGSEAVFDPHALWNLFDRRGWDVGMSSLKRRLRCKRCGSGAFVSWSRDRAATIDLPMPSRQQWKKVMSRLRS